MDEFALLNSKDLEIIAKIANFGKKDEFDGLGKCFQRVLKRKRLTYSGLSASGQSFV